MGIKSPINDLPIACFREISNWVNSVLDLDQLLELIIDTATQMMGKKKGYGSRLLNECLEDARNKQKQGVAMVTSSSVWLADKKILLKNGFESVDQAPPSFELLVKRLNDGPPPAFPTDWTERQARFGPGLTILRSDQCPYIESAVEIIVDTAAELGLPARVVELHNSQEIQATAPAPYGLFSIIYNGQLLSYHYLTKKELVKRLQEQPI